MPTVRTNPLKAIIIITIAATVIAALLISSLPRKAAGATLRQTGISTSTSLLSMDPAGLEQRMQDIRNLGATWLRIDFSWAEIQPKGPKQYKWGAYDRTMQSAARHGLQVLGTLAYTPAWAREAGCTQRTSSEEAARKCSPRDPAAFARFAGVAAERFSNLTIRGWEIWNEPNLTGYWKTVTRGNKIVVDPVAYAEVANAAARAIRAQDNDVLIISGGLAPVFDRNYAGGMRQSDFLARTLPHLDRNLFGAVGMHPYSWPKLPGQRAVYNAFYTVDHGQAEYNLRTIMARAGWGGKQIWATEFGASTKGQKLHTGTINPKAGRPDHVSESQQAAITKQGVSLWYAKRNVGPIFVHADSDQWLMKRKNEGGFGLRRSDGSQKPAYKAFQEATTTISN